MPKHHPSVQIAIASLNYCADLLDDWSYDYRVDYEHLTVTVGRGGREIGILRVLPDLQLIFLPTAEPYQVTIGIALANHLRCFVPLLLCIGTDVYWCNSGAISTAERNPEGDWIILWENKNTLYIFTCPNQAGKVTLEKRRKSPNKNRIQF